MKRNTRIILLCVIGVLIIITVVIGVTYSFMKPINETSSETKVSLNACANLTLKDTDTVVELSNSYPMSKNKALQTTPYTFTLTSSCGDRTAYSIYLATLNTNTLADENIHYILTKGGTKEIITEGLLSNATNAISEFNGYEQSELNTGINGTFSKIYKIYFNGISKDEEQDYDLYLYVDESVTDTSTMNKTFKAGVAAKVQDYTFASVTNVDVTSTTSNSISISVSASGGTNNVATYYYSINNGAYTSSTSNTKTFTGLSKGTTYTIKVYVKDTNGVDSAVYTTSAETENTVLLADYIKGLYTSQGTNGIYYHTSSLANSAADNSYRYAGANPNNYVCFGSTASTCPSDNLYRIIGVFGSEVKLIKADYTTTAMTGSGGDYYGAIPSSTSNYKGSMNTSNIASYYWNRSNGTSSTNTWSASRLNTTNLNSSYLSYIGTTWSNKIATHTWYVGGYSTSSATPKTFYNAESSGTTYSAKIGLMYVSDYGYAASNSYWTTNMSSYSSAVNNNWMYMGLYEWTISRYSSISGYAGDAFRVSTSGSLGHYIVYTDDHAVRPSFYLTSSTTYVSGSGTSADPIRIN